MRVSVVIDSPPRLCLEPEDDRDEKVLDRLMRDYTLFGHGRRIGECAGHLYVMIPLCKLGELEKHIDVMRTETARIGSWGK